MQTDKIIDKVKELSIRIFVTLILAGIIYAASMGYETETPGEIIYEITHTR